MSNLAKSAVTLNNSWPIQAVRPGAVELDVSLTLTGQGDATDKITAESLGLTKIFDCSNAVASDNSLVIATAPNAAGSVILLKAAATNAPATYTGIVIKLKVRGYR